MVCALLSHLFSSSSACPMPRSPSPPMLPFAPRYSITAVPSALVVLFFIIFFIVVEFYDLMTSKREDDHGTMTSTSF